MHLHAAKTQPGCRRIASNEAAVLVKAPTAVQRAPRQIHRDLTVNSSKSTTLNYDDLEHAVARPNPERRVLSEINFRQLIDDCPSWDALVRLEDDLRDRFDRQPGLAASLLIRASELLDVEIASEGARGQLKRMLGASLVPFIVDKGVFSYKPTLLPPLLAAVAALQYRHPRLNAALQGLLVTGSETLPLRLLASALCSATQMGIRLTPEDLDKIGTRLARLVQYCTEEDVGNIATGMVPYSKQPPSLRGRPLAALAAASAPALEHMSGEQLVHLLLMFVRQDFPLTSSWVSSFQSALLAALPGLTDPRAYTHLLFSLAKGSLAITEDFLSALLDRLAATPPPRPKTLSSSSSSSSSLLARMTPADLAVVAAVLSIYGYSPDAEWGAAYVEAVEARAGELEARQIVTIIDTCTELAVPLSPDTLDELLAVAEGGLAGLGLGRLVQLAGALSAGGHRPDELWVEKLASVLVSTAAGCNGSDLADLVTVMSYMTYAFPHDGKHMTAVLSAVKTRAEALGGLDAPTRGNILQALQQLGHPQARAVAEGLAPPPPPPVAPVANRMAAPGTLAAAATVPTGSRGNGSGRQSGLRSLAAEPSPRRTAAELPSPSYRTTEVSTTRAAARGGREAAVRYGNRDRNYMDSEYDDDDGFGGDNEQLRFDDEEEYDDDGYDTRNVTPSRGGRSGVPPPPPSRGAVQRPETAEPPPYSMPSYDDDGGFVASTRTSRRRRA